MAGLDKDICGTAMKDFLLTLTPEQKNNIEYVWQGCMNVLFEHIKNYAVVAVTSVSGVTAGGDNSGSGSGSIS